MHKTILGKMLNTENLFLVRKVPQIDSFRRHPNSLYYAVYAPLLLGVFINHVI